MIPPALVYIKIGKKGGMGLWIPVFLLWPLILPAAAMCILLAGITEPVLRIFGRGKGLFTGTTGLYQMLCAFRHLRINVRNGVETVSIRII